MSSDANQTERLIHFALYTFALVLFSQIALDTWLPPMSQDGVWFYSGLFALILAVLLQAPFFHTPKGSLAFSSIALVTLLSLHPSGPPASQVLSNISWQVATSYLVLILLSASVAMVGQKAAGTLGRISDVGYQVVTQIGGPRPIFSALFLFALFSFHTDSITEFGSIMGAWVFLIAIRPIEHLSRLFHKAREVWGGTLSADMIGEVQGHSVPGLITVSHPPTKNVGPGDFLVVPGDDQRPNVAVVISPFGVADEPRLRARQLQIPESARTELPRTDISDGEVGKVEVSQLKNLPGIDDEQLDEWERLIGVVAPGTTTKRLKIEVLRSDRDIEEGRLVSAQIGDNPAIYQVIDGVTREDIIHQENTRGYAEAIAHKVGVWNPDEDRFDPISWLPEPHSPVFLLEEEEAETVYDAVGHFPGTDFPVSVDVNDLVTHNAAVLGILGVGKTFLALELVERMLKDGIKVICLDLTTQYEDELSTYHDDDYAAQVESFLSRVEGGKEEYEENPEEGGNRPEFEDHMRRVIDHFLDRDADHVPNGCGDALIFNPERFEVWEQTGGMFKGSAKMASLSSAQITRIVAESALSAVQEREMTDKARCCLVLEEAHSLIPEFNAIAREGDKEATNGTARAILQGRKFGLGCLVVTQRTASVTKTVLNQCNTMFALRVFDATGMKFLSNYIGEDYAEMLSTLDDRHMIMSGKASSCRDPVRVRVNERDDFLEVSRNRDDDGEGVEEPQ